MQTAKMRRDSSVGSRWTVEAVLLWLVACCVLGLCCFLLSQGPGLGQQDIRAFYAAGHMLRHCPSLLFDLRAQQQWQQAVVGGTPGLPFYHPAYETLLYAPLSLLRFKTAYAVYAAVNMLLLWLCYLVSPAGNSAFSRAPGRPILFFFSFPLLFSVFVGQNSLLLLLALCLSYDALLKGRDRRAGVLLGLVTFKLATIIPLAFLLTIRRGRRFLAGFVLTFAVAIALSVWITGVSGTRDFLHLLAGATLASDNSLESQRQAAVSLHSMPNLAGLLYLCGSGHLTAHAAFALYAAATLLVLGAGAYLQRRAAHESTAFSAAVLCAVIVSPHLYIYDFAALVLPFLLLSGRWLKYVALLWFVEPLALFATLNLSWFGPAVIIPLLLLAICIAEFRSEQAEPATLPSATPAYSCPD
jgi:hypothetical protein